MSATRDGKMWHCQFYYKDWQGVGHKKNKRGFKTKAETDQWEQDFLQQKDLNINFENFVQIYYEDMEHRLRENTMRTKKFINDLKIISYFVEKLYCECYVPVSIDKWYGQIKVSSEMNALLLQLYRKTGQLEGVIALMDSWELECVNNLIDRKNIACYYKNKYQAIELTGYFDRMHDNEFIQAEIKAIDFFSELNHLRRSRRTELLSTIYDITI